MVTFTTDFTPTNDELPSSGIAYTYGANNLILTINTGIAASSQNNFGVYSGVNGSHLANSGNIVSAAQTYAGVLFAGNNGKVDNTATGHITGVSGIRLDGSTHIVNNYGTVSGFAGFGIQFTSSSLAVSIYNIGEIYGRTAGISGESAGESFFENFGKVTSDGSGIDVTTGTMTILNHGSVITDNSAAILTLGTGAVLLTNEGTLKGEVNCINATGNDFVTNKGKIIGSVGLGAGNDEFDGRGGTSGTIYGGSGNDTLIGGKGGDILWGQQDSDIFKFFKVKEIGKGATHRDKVMDFSDVEGDQIDLDPIDANALNKGNQDFHFIGKQGFHRKAGELHIVKKGGGVSIVEGDINGDGKADFQIEVLSNAPLERADFLGVF